MQEVPVLAPGAGPASGLLSPISDAAQKPLLEKLSHELSFIWDSYTIPHEIQARLSQLGFQEVSVWANLEDSKAEVRNYLKKKQSGHQTRRQRILYFAHCQAS